MEPVIMRFFEGDVPMMLASADVASGTKKRESLSANFSTNPFKYSFHSVPVMEKGGAVLEVPSVEFSVNKSSKNLEMTNEFMRFLLRTLRRGTNAKKLLKLLSYFATFLRSINRLFLEIFLKRVLHFSTAQ